MTAATCHYCGQPETDEREMRPYGPGGSWVCFPCAMGTPEREAATAAAFGALLDASSTLGPVVIGERGGVRPATSAELDLLDAILPDGEVRP